MCKPFIHDGPVRMDSSVLWRCYSCQQEWHIPEIPALILKEEFHV